MPTAGEPKEHGPMSTAVSKQETVAPARILSIVVGPYEFKARMEEERAPKTCAAFAQRLPFRNQIIHVRWSGEAGWIPMGEDDLGVGRENSTSHPAPGEVLLYPGGASETEILIPYGGCSFSSIVGQLAGNHFLTIVSGQENLRALGQLCLWEGAQEIVCDVIPDQPVAS